MSRQIPSTATPEEQRAWSAVWDALEKLQGPGSTVNLQGKRLANAGRAEGPQEYTTKAQVQALIKTVLGQDVEFRNVTVDERLRVIGLILLPRLTDGSAHHGILFVDQNGQVTVQEDGGNALDFNAAAARLELGFDMVIKWIAGLSEIACPGNGIVTISANAGAALLRLVLGADGGGSVALVPNGSKLEVRAGGGGGALIPLSADKVDGQSFATNGTDGVDFGPGAIASITIKKGIVTAAS